MKFNEIEASMDNSVTDSLRDGILTVEQILHFARQAVGTPEGCEALYDGARARTFSMIRGKDAEEADRFCNAFGQISGLARSCSPIEDVDDAYCLAVRIDVLKHLLADRVLQEQVYRVDRLKDQPHFLRCLTIIEDGGGEVLRSTLLKALGLKDTNLTRVLIVLENASLIERIRGSNVRVKLTLTGRRALAAWRSNDERLTGAVLILSSSIEGLTEASFQASAPVRVPELALAG